MSAHHALRAGLRRAFAGALVAFSVVGLCACAELLEPDRPQPAKHRAVAATKKAKAKAARAVRPVPKVVKAVPAPAAKAAAKGRSPAALGAAGPSPKPVAPAAPVAAPKAAVPPLPPAPAAPSAAPQPAPVVAPAAAPVAPLPAPAADPPPPPPPPAAAPSRIDVAPGVTVQDPPAAPAPPAAQPPPAPVPAPPVKSGQAPARGLPEASAQKSASPGAVVKGSLSSADGAALPSVGHAGSIIIGPGLGSAGSGAEEKWSVVPVLYGTDRKRRDLASRIGYGSERARKLEIGQAMVTVPKSHTVPNVERPWTLHVPYLDVSIYQQSEDPSRHFTLSKLGALDRKAFITLARERIAAAMRFKSQAVVFVHGFNTGFDAAIFRGAQLAYDLRFDGPAFVFSWPSGGGFTSYTYDRESAEQSVPYLRQFLELVLAESGAQAVSIIAHSMGNKPLLSALGDLKGTSMLAGRINQIILAAPDVDRDGFENIAAQIRGLGKGITLYASANDRAMAASRRFHGGIPRAGDVPKSGPVIVGGMDTIDVTATSTEVFALNHSGYAENAALLNDIELLLQTGERPPERRVPILQRITTGEGVYWRYPTR